MSFSVYYRRVIAYDLGHSVCFISQVRQSFFGSGLKQAGQHTVIRIWARTLAGYVYHSSAILLCMHYCMQKSCQTNFKRLYLKKKLFSKLVNTIHLESNTFICHIHRSLRILVDGCNNFSILSNHTRFHFYTSICSLPGFSRMCLVYHCSSTIMYQQYRISCKLQSRVC